MLRLIFLIFSSYIVFAQSSMFGTTFGGNHTFFHGEASNRFKENNEFVVGAEYTVHIKNLFQYRLAFMYDRFSFDKKKVTSDDIFDTSINLSYLSFSPALIYSINNRLPVFLGATFKYNLESRQLADFGVIQGDSKIEVRDFLFGISTGVGYRFRTRSFSVEPRITYERVFTNVLNDDDFSSEMSNILITVTLSFR